MLGMYEVNVACAGGQCVGMRLAQSLFSNGKCLPIARECLLWLVPQFIQAREIQKGTRSFPSLRTLLCWAIFRHPIFSVGVRRVL